MGERAWAARHRASDDKPDMSVISTWLALSRSVMAALRDCSDIDWPAIAAVWYRHRWRMCNGLIGVWVVRDQQWMMYTGWRMRPGLWERNVTSETLPSVGLQF